MFLVAFSVLWLLAGIAAMQWGARHVAGLARYVRARFGLAEAGLGALLGLSTATPELAVNITSVVLSWPELGLGAALGSNAPALPLIFAAAYVSTLWHRRAATPAPAAQGTIIIERSTIYMQALPYLGVLALLVGFLCALPESFAAWTLARDGRATAAVSGAVADGTASISLAFVPLALARTPVSDAGLYAMNIGFIAFVLLLYMLLSRRAAGGKSFAPGQTAIFIGVYVAFLALQFWYLGATQA